MNHPGKITYWDGNTNQLLREAPIAEVPPQLHFGEGPDGTKLPVVKVVAYTDGNTRRIHEYGPGGELLRTTLQTKG